MSQNKGSVKLDTGKLFLGVYHQTAFSMRKYQILHGGRSSMKTTRHTTRMVVESITTPKLISFAIAKDTTKLETGLIAEFKKVIERVTEGQWEQGKGYRYNAKDRTIIFPNGSEIHFTGSKNGLSLKGRSIPTSQHRFGFVLFDEFADYDEKHGLPLVEALVPTFLRDDYRGVDKHIVWQPRDLNLNQEARDENGEIIYETDVYGNKTPKIIPGTDTFGCKFLFAWNPPNNKEHWVYDFLEEYTSRPDCFSMKVNYTDVINELKILGMDDVIAEAETLRETNPTRYKHVWLVEATSTDGLYFNTFNPRINRIKKEDIPLDEIVKWGIGVDFGMSNPTTFVLMGVTYDGTRYIGKTYEHQNGDASSKTINDYGNDLLKFVLDAKKEYKIDGKINIYYDPSAKAFKSVCIKDKAFITNMIFNRANNKRLQTLEQLKSIIVDEKFKYVFPMPHIDSLEKEFRIAMAHDTQIIEKENDHFIDATRYVSYKLDRYAGREYRNR
jgi:PBSX family phage terminase large subunit